MDCQAIIAKWRKDSDAIQREADNLKGMEANEGKIYLLEERSACYRKCADELEHRLKGQGTPEWLSEALNSGDGTYKP